MKILKFTLSAPLQSWGEDARWDNRATTVRPTKSGIIGLLGCCLGYPRGDERLNMLNDELRIAIRTDRPGEILTDYQTVQGTDGVLLNAEGKKRSLGDTIVTPKQYLQDAKFSIFLQGDETLLDECFSAMKSPKWTPYLGRKNCIPAVPLIPEWINADSLEKAVLCFDLEKQDGNKAKYSVEMDLTMNSDILDTERIYTRNDSVIHAEKNEYRSRTVKSFVVTVGGDPA